MQTVKWKAVAQKAVLDHKAGAYSITRLDMMPNPVGHIPVNISQDIDVFVRKGPILNPVDLRRYLWLHRESRALRRPGSLLWTAYNPEDDTSYVGIGATINVNAVPRLPATIRPLLDSTHG